MSSSAAKSSNSKDFVTRRVRDKDGNIIVKRYKKRSSGLNIQIPWKRMPAITLGLAFGLYGYVINLYRNDELTKLDLLVTNLSIYLNYYLDQIVGVTALFLTGAIAVGLSTFLAWALITRGFKITQYGVAARQLLAIIAIGLLFSAVFSAFINEAGITRQADDPQDNNQNYDLSGLEAPFYKELLDGLLDLIGNIDDPTQIMANIAPTGGETFDPGNDTYLWRWLIAESYGTQGDPFDYIKGYENYRGPYTDADPATFNDIYPNPDTKKFRVSQQFWSLTQGYTGEVIAPWNSLHDVQVDTSNVTIEGSSTEGDISINSAETYAGINSQPFYKASLSSSGSVGYLDYDAYFIEDDKQSIIQNSFSYEDTAQGVRDETFDGQIASERFGDLANAGTLSSIWGNESLPSYYLTNDAQYGDPTEFNDKYNNYLQNAINNGLSAYDVVLQITNEIQNALIGMYQTQGASAINPSDDAATANEAGDGLDRAFYFWNQVNNDGLFGIKDAIAGFVNLLRALEIPARPVLGFSVGDVNSTNIQLRLEHLNVWIEALLPWNDNGVTRYSWGAFNPIPNAEYLAQGEFVYGRNSLGGAPDIEIEANSGTQTNIPDQNVGDQSVFTLGQLGVPLTFGTRLLYEDVPTGNQMIELKILNEDEINLASSGTFDQDLGTELGQVQTSNTAEAWANVSLTVGSNGNVNFTDHTGFTSSVNTTILPIDFGATVNNRNVYAIVAQFGLSFNYFVAGWSLQADLTIEPNSQVVKDESVIVDQTGIYETAQFSAIYSFVGEQLVYDVTATSSEGDPLSGQPIELYFLNPDQLTNIDDLIANNNLPSPKSSNITDSNGATQFTYKILPSDVGPGYEYYSMVVFIQPDNYASLNIHITDEFIQTGSFDLVNDGDYIINDGEIVTWGADLSVTVTDSTLAGFGSISGRPAYFIPTDYYILNRDYYEANNGSDAALIAALGSCTSNYGDDTNCYLLANVTSSSSMGVVSDSLTGPSLEQITLISGIVPYYSYYLVAYLPDQNFVYYNNSQKFYMLPPAAPASLDNVDLTINFVNADTKINEFETSSKFNPNNTMSNSDWSIGVLMMLSFVTITRLQLGKRREVSV